MGPMTERCSALSRQHGEPIAGSAVAQTSAWIVLEHCGPWGAKAVPESDLPEAVKARLMGWPDQIEGARVQLVRRTARTGDPLYFWLASSDPASPRLVRFVLPTAEAVLALDVPALVAALRRGEPLAGATECEGSLVLVCTNGRRDVCCSKLGIPVAQALSEQEGLEVWQTTHLGGHRFAATLLLLPAGICYGRVEPDEAPALAESIRTGRLHRLDRLRGRTALAAPEQAAEAIWRERTGRMTLDDLARATHERRGAQAVVTLRDREGGSHQIVMEHRSLGVSARPSCNKPPAPVEGWYAAP